MENAVNLDIQRCVDEFSSFEKQGYIVIYGNPIVNVDITDTTITTYLNYPVQLEKDNYLFQEENFIYVLDRDSNIRIVTDRNGVALKAFTITSVDGRAELIVPQGIKVNSYELSVKIKDNRYDKQEYGLMSSIIYRFEPSGVNFDPGAILRISYEDSWFPEGFDETKLKIVYFDSREEKFVSLASDVDTVHNRITATVTHFTDFTIAQCECFDLSKARSELSTVGVVKDLQDVGITQEGKKVYEFSIPPGNYYLAALSSQPEYKDYIMADSLEINGQLQEDWKGLNDSERYFFLNSFACGATEDVEDDEGGDGNEEIDITCKENSDCMHLLPPCDMGGQPWATCLNEICEFGCVFNECDNDQECGEGYICDLLSKRCVEPPEEEEVEEEEVVEEGETILVEEDLCDVKLVLSYISETEFLYVLEDGFSVPRACEYPTVGPCSMENLEAGNLEVVVEPIYIAELTEDVECNTGYQTNHECDVYVHCNHEFTLPGIEVPEAGDYCLILSGGVATDQPNENGIFTISGDSSGNIHAWVDEENIVADEIVIPFTFTLKAGSHDIHAVGTEDGENPGCSEGFEYGSLRVEEVSLAIYGSESVSEPSGLPEDMEKILPMPECALRKEIGYVCSCLDEFYENCPPEENCVCTESGAECGYIIEDEE